MGILGVLTVILVVAVIHVAISDERKTYFDELVSTGGAIRSARDVHSDLKDNPVKICQTEDCKKVAKYINASMNHSIDPCEDFFDYVCGGWIKANPIPKSSSTYSTFAKLNGHVERNLRRILEKRITSSSKRLFQLPKKFYDSCSSITMRSTLDPPRDALRACGRAQTALPGAMSAHIVDRVFEELQGRSYDLPSHEEH